MSWLLYKTNKFNFAVSLYSDNAQRTSKRGKNISQAASRTSSFSPRFDHICALSEYSPTAKWNRFIKYWSPSRTWSTLSRDGAVVRASMSRVRFLNSASYMGWVCCWFSSLLREVFLRVLWFSHSSQTFPIFPTFNLIRNLRATGQWLQTVQKKEVKTLFQQGGPFSSKADIHFIEWYTLLSVTLVKQSLIYFLIVLITKLNWVTYSYLYFITFFLGSHSA